MFVYIGNDQHTEARRRRLVRLQHGRVTLNAVLEWALLVLLIVLVAWLVCGGAR